MISMISQKCNPRRAENQTARKKGNDSMQQHSYALPKIDAGDYNLARVTEEAWRALKAANNPACRFRYGDSLASIERDENGASVVRLMTPDYLRGVLARVAHWYRVRRNVDVDALPPMHVVKDILVQPDIEFPVLARIVEAPVFAANNRLHIKPGYDAASRCYFAPATGLQVPDVPQQPSPADISSALSLINQELLGDFPFVGEAERAHADALFLLPFARELIAGITPLHMIEKTSPGTGGSLLADALTFPFLGRSVSVLFEGSNEDEWRKRITAKLLDAGSIVLIDNLRNRLDSGALSAALTSLMWQDRILGKSLIVNLPVRVVWIATGNNPTFSNELSRRIVRIRLDSGVDQPWLRNGFRHANLREWVSSHRPQLIWAALTLIQAWIAAGKPEGKLVMGSYEEWSKVMGGILEVNGVDGFLGNLQDLYRQSDAEGQAWKAFVDEWWQRLGTQQVGVNKLYDIVSPTNGDPIDLNLGDGNERSQKTRLGRLLVQNRDKRFGNLMIAEDGTKQGAQQWKLVKP
jgi:putative DNA primase/helicase